MAALDLDSLLDSPETSAARVRNQELLTSLLALVQAPHRGPRRREQVALEHWNLAVLACLAAGESYRRAGSDGPLATTLASATVSDPLGSNRLRGSRGRRLVEAAAVCLAETASALEGDRESLLARRALSPAGPPVRRHSRLEVERSLEAQLRSLPESPQAWHARGDTLRHLAASAFGYAAGRYWDLGDSNRFRDSIAALAVLDIDAARRRLERGPGIKAGAQAAALLTSLASLCLRRRPPVRRPASKPYPFQHLVSTALPDLDRLMPTIAQSWESNPVHGADIAVQVAYSLYWLAQAAFNLIGREHEVIACQTALIVLDPARFWTDTQAAGILHLADQTRMVQRLDAAGAVLRGARHRLTEVQDPAMVEYAQAVAPIHRPPPAWSDTFTWAKAAHPSRTLNRVIAALDFCTYQGLWLHAGLEAKMAAEELLAVAHLAYNGQGAPARAALCAGALCAGSTGWCLSTCAQSSPYRHQVRGVLVGHHRRLRTAMSAPAR